MTPEEGQEEFNEVQTDLRRRDDTVRYNIAIKFVVLHVLLVFISACDSLLLNGYM